LGKEEEVRTEEGKEAEGEVSPFASFGKRSFASTTVVCTSGMGRGRGGEEERRKTNP